MPSQRPTRTLLYGGECLAVEIKKQQTDDNSKKEYCEDELDKAEDKK